MKDMDSKSLATSFIEYFCNADLSGIESLLSTNFKLKGPLFKFDSKLEYINSLKGNLEADPKAEILSVIGSESESSAIYKYRGNTINQLFRCREGKIVETVLDFDTKNLPQNF